MNPLKTALREKRPMQRLQYLKRLPALYKDLVQLTGHKIGNTTCSVKSYVTEHEHRIQKDCVPCPATASAIQLPNDSKPMPRFGRLQASVTNAVAGLGCPEPLTSLGSQRSCSLHAALSGETEGVPPTLFSFGPHQLQGQLCKSASNALLSNVWLPLTAGVK